MEPLGRPGRTPWHSDPPAAMRIKHGRLPSTKTCRCLATGYINSWVHLELCRLTMVYRCL